MENCVDNMISSMRVTTQDRLRLTNAVNNLNFEESPTQILGKLSAVAMLTTLRVGDTIEDATMAEARGRLSLINEKGFVTTNSQMGVDKINTIHSFMSRGREDGDPDMFNPVWEERRREGTLPELPYSFRHRQREFVDGIYPTKTALLFYDKMSKIDGVLVLMHPHVNGNFPSSGESIPLTEQSGKFPTQQPLIPMPMDQILLDLLPGIEGIVSSESCRDTILRDSVQVHVIDMIWGRKFWLMDKIIEVLNDIEY